MLEVNPGSPDTWTTVSADSLALLGRPWEPEVDPADVDPDAPVDLETDPTDQSAERSDYEPAEDTSDDAGEPTGSRAIIELPWG